MAGETPLSKRLLWTSLAWGAGVAIAVATLVTAWNWIENPHGIFHGQIGTHWDLVLQTAFSWLVPVFFYASAITFLVQLFRAGIRRLWGRNGW